MAELLEKYPAALELENMNIVMVGHVDHGKSTILGRLLADTGSLPSGKLESVRERCRRNAKPFEYAFLIDALKDEQAQGITIDSARCFFKTALRNYILIDTPGHIEFLKNMVTGAARAEAALLVIDADEGVKENSRRHGYMLSMLGIRQIAVLVNKMDLVGYAEPAYRQIVYEYADFLRQIGIVPQCFIPVSGMSGDNIARPSSHMLWHKGKTVLQVLDSFENAKPLSGKHFRMPVQDVYKFTGDGDDRRIVAGTILAGELKAGDEVIFSPSGKRSQVKTIEAFNREKMRRAEPGWAVGFTLTEQVYAKRGEMASLVGQTSPHVSDRLTVSLFWLGRQPMVKGRKYHLKLGTAKVACSLERIRRVIDAASLETTDKDWIERNDVAECSLILHKRIAFDLPHETAENSRFVIIDNYDIAGGGIIRSATGEADQPADSGVGKNLTWQEGKVGQEVRRQLLHQKGLVVWLTGLSGSGKSTLAVEVEKALFQQGHAAYRLDGDNIRCGLNSNLGFDEKDRNENIRRIAEVAALFKDAGLITLVSFISPYANMRSYARERVGADAFVEVYVKADLATCAARDAKGLYSKVANGEIKEFTGISSPYEEPENPDLVLDTTELTVDEAVEEILADIAERQHSAGFAWE